MRAYASKFYTKADLRSVIHSIFYLMLNDTFQDSIHILRLLIVSDTSKLIVSSLAV